MDRDLRYTWMENPSLGYEPEKVVGRTDAELLPHGSAVSLMELKRRVIERGESIQEEVAVAAADQTNWYCLTAHPMRDESGAIVGLAGQATNITDQVRARHELLESESRYRRILETTLEGVCTSDAQNVVTFVNPAMAEMLGCEPAEMIGRSALDFIAEPDLDQALGTVAEHQGFSGQREVRLRGVDGREIWSLVAANPLRGGNGEYLGVLAMVTDISERKKMELRFRQLADHDPLTGMCPNVGVRCVARGRRASPRAARGSAVA